jgi:hypothetical protein
MCPAQNIIASILCAVLFLMVFQQNLLISKTISRTEITGTVADKATTEPLPMVHVYISNTTSGTVTEEDGTFRFSTSITGNAKLVFSYIGYKTIMKELLLDGSEQTHRFEITLERSAIQLGELEVRASNSEWQQKFNHFRHQFFGTTRYAQEVEILNPWVIDLQRDQRGRLHAVSSEPLNVVNYAFGYEIHIDLVKFLWERSGETGMYIFYSRFTEMEPENRQQRRTWHRNRDRAYTGSQQHFLKSLYHETISTNRFEIRYADSDLRMDIEKLNEMELRRITGRAIRTQTDSGDYIKGFRTLHPVDVHFRQNPGQTVLSRIVPLTGSGVFLVTQHGRLDDPTAIRLDGEWARHRVGNLLPDDYSLNN